MLGFPVIAHPSTSTDWMIPANSVSARDSFSGLIINRALNLNPRSYLYQFLPLEVHGAWVGVGVAVGSHSPFPAVLAFNCASRKDCWQAVSGG